MFSNLCLLQTCQFDSNNIVIEPCYYSSAAQAADGAFAFVPIFTTLQLLMMFRINRTVGILQISFTKMLAVDVFVWIILILIILLGYREI